MILLSFNGRDMVYFYRRREYFLRHNNCPAEQNKKPKNGDIIVEFQSDKYLKSWLSS
jgi:hypothetical protein